MNCCYCYTLLVFQYFLCNLFFTDWKHMEDPVDLALLQAVTATTTTDPTYRVSGVFIST